MTTNEPEKKRAHPKVAFLLRSFLKSSPNSPFCWGAKKRKKQKREREREKDSSLSLSLLLERRRYREEEEEERRKKEKKKKEKEEKRRLHNISRRKIIRKSEREE